MRDGPPETVLESDRRLPSDLAPYARHVGDEVAGLNLLIERRPLDPLEAAAARDRGDRLRHFDDRRADAGADVVRAFCHLTRRKREQRIDRVVDVDVVAALTAVAV